MLAIRLPDKIEKRLARLAKRTGRTKTYYAREAILQHLDDLEDCVPRRRRPWLTFAPGAAKQFRSKM